MAARTWSLSVEENDMKKNKQKRKVTAKPMAGKRTRILPLTIIIGAAALVGTLIFAAPRRQPEKKVVVQPVHGEAINLPPQSNSTAVAGTLTPPAITAEGPKIEKPVKSGDYLAVGFDKLGAFPIQTRWEMTDPVRIKGTQIMKNEVPPSIKALDGEKVAVQGFMMPVKLENGLVKEFFLMKNQASCCYGIPMQANEMLTVHMTGAAVKCTMDQPLTVCGKLHVSETHNENGSLNSIYRLDGDKMDLSDNL